MVPQFVFKSGTTTELNLADYFRLQGMAYKPVVFDTMDQTAKGFDSGRCDVLTSDQSQLYGLRLEPKRSKLCNGITRNHF